VAQTPAIFRHRVLVMGAVFALTAGLSRLVWAWRPMTSLVGRVSLDQRFWLGSRLPLAGAPMATLAAPIVLVLGGAALRWSGTSYLRGHIMIDKQLHADRLIVSGPFRWTRNPLYLGNMLVIAGFSLFFPPPALFIGIVLMLVAVMLLIKIEEDALLESHHDAFLAYKAAVPRFLPKTPTADVPEGTPVEPDWLNGARAEMFNVFLIGYFVLLAIHQELAAIVLIVVSLALGIQQRRANAKARGDT
jgi:hypothetical protein